MCELLTHRLVYHLLSTLFINRTCHSMNSPWSHCISGREGGLGTPQHPTHLCPAPQKQCWRMVCTEPAVPPGQKGSFSLLVSFCPSLVGDDYTPGKDISLCPSETQKAILGCSSHLQWLLGFLCPACICSICSVVTPGRLSLCPFPTVAASD